MIDSHQHFWNYSAEEYGWIDESMAGLRRDFLPGDLLKAMQGAGVDRSIAVQARQSVEETAWLLKLAGENDFVAGVVGWAPLAADGLGDFLTEYGDAPKLVGLRHVVQGEAAGFLDGKAFNEGVVALDGTGLVYDVLIFERQLEEAIRFVDRHPRQSFVLDHVAKPRIAEGILEPWREQIRELGQRSNVVCKVSGMVTEAGSGWTEAMLWPYLDGVVEAFGVERLMVGSDWPVCLARCEYGQWWETVRHYFAGFSHEEREAIFGGTAAAVYL